tara:strand:+ start:292 stop:393 length:102 start_codon:yes stop_codon:yes gene_type:complete
MLVVVLAADIITVVGQDVQAVLVVAAKGVLVAA